MSDLALALVKALVVSVLNNPDCGRTTANVLADALGDAEREAAAAGIAVAVAALKGRARLEATIKGSDHDCDAHDCDDHDCD